MRYKQLKIWGLSLWALVALCASSATAATLNPLTTFGGADPGWRAPAELLPGDVASADTNSDGFYDFLWDVNDGIGFPDLERGIAYNATTGNLLLLSRFGNPDTVKGLRILDGSTGVDKGFVDFDTTNVTGGTFTRNMIGVAEDGAIYMANLTTNVTSNPFKIYRWDNEAAASPTLAYSGAPLAGARLGDTFDVIGSGANTRLVAGYARNPSVSGNNSFAIFDTIDGLNFTATNVSVASTPPDGGDFGLGITFQDEDTVIGMGSFSTTTTQPRIVDVSGSTGTLTDSFATDGFTLRPMDFAIIDGRPILAIMEASNSTDPIARARLFVYDMSDLSLPLAERKIAEASALPTGMIQNANINGTGQVKFGPIEGRTAIIYGLSTNNGIQAFELTIDPVSSDDADFDGDGNVDGQDFLTWQRNFGLIGGATLMDGDANGDQNVDGLDLSVWQNQYGTVPPLSAAVVAVPEPATAWLALSGLVCFWTSRRNSR
ncbi:DUF4623 domain-containing protein [Bythopirellula goksoeyrii]|uniref:PEP-CTERM protein-sorting domain-containing protein n=1 Tax=Bythopirellula goksoeyrii TaxID=1400387 RepID=A0A5B9Q1I2_9BACT|nr:DUF4623 domain-containing protein [Bythopirellula goksoeyrii]QEG32907.1 hypothetical protein Pr1d_01680 [Bythopirellula goksoeyrii]